MDLDILSQFNPWWTTGQVRADLLEDYHRPLFDEMVEYLDDRQILLVYGLRRVGKTTLFYQLIDHLLANGVGPDHILYFSFDEATGGIRDVISTYESQVLRKPIADAGRIYLFLDEIQKVPDWDQALKVQYDLYPGLKILICGSASLNLRRRSGESLAGRLYDFHLSTLSFREFLHLKGINVDYSQWKLSSNTVRPLFWDYLRKGGFPEITDLENEQKIAQYIRRNIIDRIVYVDIPIEFGINDLKLLGFLVEWICRNPGVILNHDSLSRQLGKNRLTITNYIEYLEYSLLIRRVGNLRSNFLSTSRKMKKAYPSSTGFAYSFLREPDSGKVFETFIMQSLQAGSYFRKGGDEIDFILRDNERVTPIEVKSGGYSIQTFRKLLKKYDFNFGLIASLEDFEESVVDGISIHVVPGWVLALFPDEVLSQSP